MAQRRAGPCDRRLRSAKAGPFARVRSPDRVAPPDRTPPCVPAGRFLPVAAVQPCRGSYFAAGGQSNRGLVGSSAGRSGSERSRPKEVRLLHGPTAAFYSNPFLTIT